MCKLFSGSASQHWQSFLNFFTIVTFIKRPARISFGVLKYNTLNIIRCFHHAMKKEESKLFSSMINCTVKDYYFCYSQFNTRNFNSFSFMFLLKVQVHGVLNPRHTICYSLKKHRLSISLIGTRFRRKMFCKKRDILRQFLCRFFFWFLLYEIDLPKKSKFRS